MDDSLRDARSERERALDRLVRLVCVGFALSSFPLAAVLLVSPETFWSSLDVGGNPFVEAIYGAAIAGEGVIFAFGAREPARYRTFFDYMVVYKTLSVIAGARIWLTMPDRPLGGLAVLGGWAVAGLISAVVAWQAHRLRHDAR